MLFFVTHKCIVTDHLEYTKTLVEADTPQEAVEIFNALAEKRTNYPYGWEKVDESHVYSASVLRKGEHAMPPMPGLKEFVAEPQPDEHTVTEKKVQVGGDTDLVVKDKHTVMVYMANGGHVRVTSETPLKVFCKPEG